MKNAPAKALTKRRYHQRIVQDKRRIVDEREADELIKEAHAAVMAGYADDEQHALAFRGLKTW